MPLYSLLHLVPRNVCSAALGKLAACPLPPFILKRLIGLYCAAYQVDETEVRLNRSQFRSMAEFFTRELKAGARREPTSDAHVVLSPCDGTLRSSGTITSGRIEDVKGRAFEVAELIGDEYRALQFEGGSFFNCYLSPRDYHHVHAPVCGRVLYSTYIPGTLLPVNNWSIENIEQVFCRNERIVTYLETPRGVVAVVMVGAFNVGKMTVVFDSWCSNSSYLARGVERWSRCYSEPINLKAAELLGTFHLGSTVIMLLSRRFASELRIEELHYPQAIQYGELLGTLSSKH